MKRKLLVLMCISIIGLNSFSQTLSGTYLNIWSTDSHLGQFGFDDNSAGQTRPRVDIWALQTKLIQNSLSIPVVLHCHLELIL